MWSLLPPLLEGMKTTLLITLYGIAAAFVLAFAAGFGRLSKVRAIRAATLVYVEIFRGTSLLVQLFWMYFVLPVLLDVRIPALGAAVLALGLNYGAYGSEVVRSCVQAVPKGQTEAAIALNLTPGQRMRRIILPQAWRMMLPAFGNLQIELLKGTSLVYFITLSDITFRGMVLRTNDLTKTPAIFALMLLLYFAVAFALTRLIRYFERRAAAGRG